MSGLRHHYSGSSPYTTRTNSGTNNQGNEYTAKRYSDGTRSYRYQNRDGGVYDKHPDGSAVYHAPNGTVRYYHQHCYSDEDRSDGRYYSSESPEETDSEHDYRREGGGPGPSREYHVSDDRGVVVPPPVPDSESPSEEGVPESESETETEDCSDRYVPEEYESGSACDRDDYSYDSYGDSFDDDDYDDEDSSD